MAAPGERHEPSKSRKRRPSEGEGSIENLNKHEPKANRAYECRICKRSFQKSTALGGDTNRHRLDRERETPQEAPVALVQETQQHQLVNLSHSWNVQTGLCHFKMTALGSLPILNWRMETKFSSNNLEEEFKVSIVYKEQQNIAHRNQDGNVNANAPRGFSPVVKKESTGTSFHDGGSAK